MSQRDSSHSSNESLATSPDIPLCIVCEEAACGVGPFSRCHLCQQHLAVDVAAGRRQQRDVNEDLRPYSEGVSAKVAALLEEQQELSRKMCDMEEKFSALQESLNSCRVWFVENLRARQETVAACLRDYEDVACYGREVQEVEVAGDMAEMCNLVLSMQLSVPDLHADFLRAARVRLESEDALERGLRSLRKLQQMVSTGWVDSGADATDAGVTASPEMSDAGVTAFPEMSDAGVTASPEMTARPQMSDVEVSTINPSSGQIVWSHNIQLEGNVMWVSVCSDTSKFRGDRTGRVMPAQSAGADSVALPQPCLVASVDGTDHLTVLSVDGSVRMHICCKEINWSNVIYGLHCDRHLVFIAQEAQVTVTALSGHVIHKIRREFVGFGGAISGIGGNAASVFVSSGNRIAAFSKTTWQLETIITLAELPKANLRNLEIQGNCILVADLMHDRVHRVRIDTKQVVATHPTLRAGLASFSSPYNVTTDSRGRMFVSEFAGQSVRALSADDGSLLWTLGVPNESGSGDARLNFPLGLVVVTGGPCEKLVVADNLNCRLLVLNLV